MSVSFDDPRPFPGQGWEMRRNDKGQKYFFNNRTKNVSHQDPRPPVRPRARTPLFAQRRNLKTPPSLAREHAPSHRLASRDERKHNHGYTPQSRPQRKDGDVQSRVRQSRHSRLDYHDNDGNDDSTFITDADIDAGADEDVDAKDKLAEITVDVQKALKRMSEGMKLQKYRQKDAGSADRIADKMVWGTGLEDIKTACIHWSSNGGWFSGPKMSVTKKRTMELRHCILLQGKQTPLLKETTSAISDRCFSIVNSERSLDLEALSKHRYDIFMTGLVALMDPSSYFNTRLHKIESKETLQSRGSRRRSRRQSRSRNNGPGTKTAKLMNRRPSRSPTGSRLIHYDTDTKHVNNENKNGKNGKEGQEGKSGTNAKSSKGSKGSNSNNIIISSSSEAGCSTTTPSSTTDVLRTSSMDDEKALELAIALSLQSSMPSVKRKVSERSRILEKDYDDPAEVDDADLEWYRDILRMSLLDTNISPEELEMIESVRKKRGIDDQEHEASLEAVG